MFSFVLLDIDLKKEKLYFVSGGHPDQLFIQNKQIYELQRTGRIIGLLEDCTYRTTILDFKPGDKLFLFTDGIFEEFNDEDEIFGEEKLKEIIEKYIDEPYMLIMSYVMKELYEFTGSVGITDDLTMLSVEFSKE